MLVIGTGAAGLRAAIELAERDVQVLCVSTSAGGMTRIPWSPLRRAVARETTAG